MVSFKGFVFEADVPVGFELVYCLFWGFVGELVLLDFYLIVSGLFPFVTIAPFPVYATAAPFPVSAFL